ncbi:hypothetical protein [Zobellella sp. DQSA1]|uniref:hypothetical protein n=1 Tax=Zobellella sp. DQSA1 TaxID=3342386 RepID=UPI0035BEDECB
MTWGWVTLGTIAQLMLAYMLFMMAIFAGAGAANGAELSRLQLQILTLAIYVLPAVPVFSGVVAVPGRCLGRRLLVVRPALRSGRTLFPLRRPALTPAQGDTRPQAQQQQA